MMWLFGYALPLVVSATLLMYLCYMVAVLPAYRFMLFWFRLGGFVTVLNEPAEWKTQAPWEQASDHLALLKQRTRQFGTRTTVRMGSGVAWVKALF